MYRLQRQVKKLYRRVQREQPVVAGLSTTTLQMLVALERAAGPLRPGELAAELEMKNSNVASALRGLDKQGLINRRADPADGRKVLIDLTGEGRRRIADARRRRTAWLQEAVDELLTPKEQSLLFAAADLMERLAEQGADDEPQARRRAG